MDEVSTTEMMEVQAVNVIAPFVLCSKLKLLIFTLFPSAYVLFLRFYPYNIFFDKK